MSNDCSIVSRGSGEFASVSTLFFQVTYDGSFGHRSDWENISDLESSSSAAINELSSVHAFGGEEQFLP